MKKLTLILSPLFLLLTMCQGNQTKKENVICQQVEASEPFTETIYLNLDATNDSFWQLCHAELENSVNPFVILTKLSAKKKDSTFQIKKMKFKSEPFVGNKNYYKILNVSKAAKPYEHGKFNMYDVKIKVGLRNEVVTNDNLNDFQVDKLTAFDYHVELSSSLQEFISCNIEFKLKDSVFFMNDEEKERYLEDNICCGAICASRFIY